MKIKEITAWAKEFMLEDGSHGPTVFLETHTKLLIAGLGDMPATPQARLPYFLEAGRRLAADHPGERVREAAFIAMAWASKQFPGDPPPKKRPSQDPKRMEVLTISHLTFNDDGSTTLGGQMVEIIRDNQGKVRDLYHLPDKVEGGQDPLLLLFSLGFEHPKLSNSDIVTLLQEKLGPE